MDATLSSTPLSADLPVDLEDAVKRIMAMHRDAGYYMRKAENWKAAMRRAEAESKRKAAAAKAAAEANKTTTEGLCYTVFYFHDVAGTLKTNNPLSFFFLVLESSVAEPSTEPDESSEGMFFSQIMISVLHVLSLEQSYLNWLNLASQM